LTVVNEDWEREARDWIAWARAPGHDAYWRYRDAFFELVPAAGRATLDIGCGEGRVTRDLAARGHAVNGVDTAPTLVEAAAAAHPDGRYLVADAAALPFADRAFDVVTAYNSLMDVADMRGAVAEAARVLDPGGRLCVCVTHPLNDAGDFTERHADAPFVIEGSYFGRRRFEGVEERDGLRMAFHGWSYGLEEYARVFEDAGLAIDALREPLLPAGAALSEPPSARWRRIPMFLMLRLRRITP
jgi:SAM-dependent methyltransferase